MGNLCSVCCGDSKPDVQGKNTLENKILLMKLKTARTIKESHCKIEKLSNSAEYMAFNNKLLKEENSYLKSKSKASQSAYLQKTAIANVKQEFALQKLRKSNVAISRELSIYQRKVSISCIFKYVQKYKTCELKISFHHWRDAASSYPEYKDTIHTTGLETYEDDIHRLDDCLFSSAKKFKDKKASDKCAIFSDSQILRTLLNSNSKSFNSSSHQKETENIRQSGKLSSLDATLK